MREISKGVSIHFTDKEKEEIIKEFQKMFSITDKESFDNMYSLFNLSGDYYNIVRLYQLLGGI